MTSLLETVGIVWAVVTLAYFGLFLYRSLVGMREEDTLYLSAGESRMAAEQHESMKRCAQPLTLKRWHKASCKYLSGNSQRRGVFVLSSIFKHTLPI